MSRLSAAQPQHPEWQRGHTLESHFYLLSIWLGVSNGYMVSMPGTVQLERRAQKQQPEVCGIPS